MWCQTDPQTRSAFPQPLWTIAYAFWAFIFGLGFLPVYMSWEDEPTGGCELLFEATSSYNTYVFLRLLFIKWSKSSKEAEDGALLQEALFFYRKFLGSKPQTWLKFSANFDFGRKTCLSLFYSAPGNHIILIPLLACSRCNTSYRLQVRNIKCPGEKKMLWLTFADT